MSDYKGAAIRDEILEIAIRWRQAVEKLEKIEGKLPSDYLIEAILAILAQEVKKEAIEELKEVVDMALTNYANTDNYDMKMLANYCELRIKDLERLG